LGTRKSNLNVSEHKFSHYLTRWAYTDPRRVVDAQTVGYDQIKVKIDTKDGEKGDNLGMLCVLDPKHMSGLPRTSKVIELSCRVLTLVRQQTKRSVTIVYDLSRALLSIPIDILSTTIGTRFSIEAELRGELIDNKFDSRDVKDEKGGAITKLCAICPKICWKIIDKYNAKNIKC
jgi:hypothetical protein